MPCERLHPVVYVNRLLLEVLKFYNKITNVKKNLAYNTYHKTFNPKLNKFDVNTTQIRPFSSVRLEHVVPPDINFPVGI